MRLNEVVYTDAEPIEGYGHGFFRIGGQTLVSLAADVDVLFIGTGTEIAHIPKELQVALEAVGLGVEVMNSPAACRTYNVLLSEGRRVALALLPVD
mgnify:CR=1 FL=1